MRLQRLVTDAARWTTPADDIIGYAPSQSTRDSPRKVRRQWRLQVASANVRGCYWVIVCLLSAASHASACLWAVLAAQGNRTTSVHHGGLLSVLNSVVMLSAGRHSSAHAGLQRVAAQRLAAELAAQQRHGVAAGLTARLESAAAGRGFESGRSAGACAPQLSRPDGFPELCCSGDSPVHG